MRIDKDAQDVIFREWKSKTTMVDGENFFD